MPSARRQEVQLTDAAVVHAIAAAIDDRLDVAGGNGRGERVSAETKYQPLLIPVANVPSHIGRIEDTA